MAPQNLEYLVEFEHQQFELYEARRQSHAKRHRGGAQSGWAVLADFVRCIIRNVAQKLAKSVHLTYWSPGELWEVADGFQVSRVSGGVAVVAFG